jgi:DNA-binding NarL/FixJ family response regulator
MPFLYRTKQPFRKNKNMNQQQLLSAREQQILTEMSKGKTNKTIAEILHISTETVKKHAQKIYLKLHAKNRTEASFINQQK